MTPSPASTDQRLADMAAFPEMNPGPVIRTDESGTILLVNAAARDLFQQDDLPGRRWTELCPNVDAAMWQEVVSGTDRLSHESEIAGRIFTFTYRRPPNVPSVFIYGNDITALRAAEEALRQSEKMATLGTLAAGVAHELNNPAAAAARGADQLREAFAKLQDALIPLTGLSFSPARATALFDLVRWDRDHSARASHIDPLTRSDLESEIESWLDDRDVEQSWEQAPALVSLGYDIRELDRLAEDWADETAAVVAFVARAQPVLALAREIEDATRRISEIVTALKTYSHLGGATVRAIDLTEGIESTLVMLRSKLKTGIDVVREYEPGLPQIEAFGGELNQVWTNLIDNSADAMNGKGRITIRARRDGEFVIVEIEDDGPGIPDSARAFLFDPFFTTKEPGKGTGLGLSTSRSIVVKKHGGTIDVRSRPGSTIFTVRLPIHLAPANGGAGTSVPPSGASTPDDSDSLTHPA